MDDRVLLDYLLVYIAEGRGRFSIDGQAVDVGPGDLFLVPPGVVSAMEGFEPGMVCPYVHFDLIYRADVSAWDFSIPGGRVDVSEFAPLAHPAIPSGPLARLRGCVRGFTNHRVGELITEICQEASRAQPYAYLRMSGLMMEIIAEMLRGQTGLDEECDAHVPQLEAAAEWMRNQPGDGAAVDQAATMANLSRSYFRMLFQKHYGCSPREYLTRSRIRQAKEWMITSTLNISEISDRVGYASVHSFSRAFKHVEGVSPREYRTFGRMATRVEGRIADEGRVAPVKKSMSRKAVRKKRP
jgi:AraC-like DNA-binding protein